MKKYFALMAIAAMALVSCHKDPVIDEGGNEGDDSEEYRYVDLGLSVNWAIQNVGAAKDAEKGWLVSWGATKPKPEGTPYEFSTYEHAETHVKTDGSTVDGWINKYCSNAGIGTPDYKFFLEAEDDAATVNWGAPWRTPTYDEWAELCDPEKCTWEDWKHDSKLGAKVTSKVPGYEGNWIFLPYTGYRDNAQHLKADVEGWYWTSLMRNDPQYWAHCKVVSPTAMATNPTLITSCSRADGLAVRPVRAK